MTDEDEKLSRLLDDQPGVDPAIDDALADVNLQYRLRRYRMIGEVMRNELPQVIDTDFHHSVMARIRTEDALQAAAEPVAADVGATASPWLWVRWKSLAGLAVAASVALVTVSLWQPLQQQAEPTDGGIASSEQIKIEEIARSLEPANAVPAALGMRWKLEQDAPEIQQKLNAYLVNHTEYSNSMQGLIPQARVAGFDAQQ